MIQVQVENIDKVMTQLVRAASLIDNAITMAMFESLNNALNYLNNQYPDLKFQSQWFSESKEFWIYVDQIILCKATGKRVDTQTEGQIGRRSQEGESYSAVPKTEVQFAVDFNLQEIQDKIGIDTTLKIMEMINKVLR